MGILVNVANETPNIRIDIAQLHAINAPSKKEIINDL